MTWNECFTGRCLPSRRKSTRHANDAAPSPSATLLQDLCRWNPIQHLKQMLQRGYRKSDLLQLGQHQQHTLLSLLLQPTAYLNPTSNEPSRYLGLEDAFILRQLNKGISKATGEAASATTVLCPDAAITVPWAFNTAQRFGVYGLETEPTAAGSDEIPMLTAAASSRVVQLISQLPSTAETFILQQERPNAEQGLVYDSSAPVQRVGSVDTAAGSAITQAFRDLAARHRAVGKELQHLALGVLLPPSTPFHLLPGVHLNMWFSSMLTSPQVPTRANSLALNFHKGEQLDVQFLAAAEQLHSFRSNILHISGLSGLAQVQYLALPWVRELPAGELSALQRLRSLHARTAVLDADAFGALLALPALKEVHVLGLYLTTNEELQQAQLLGGDARPPLPACFAAGRRSSTITNITCMAMSLYGPYEATEGCLQRALPALKHLRMGLNSPVWNMAALYGHPRLEVVWLLDLFNSQPQSLRMDAPTPTWPDAPLLASMPRLRSLRLDGLDLEHADALLADIGNCRRLESVVVKQHRHVSHSDTMRFTVEGMAQMARNMGRDSRAAVVIKTSGYSVIGDGSTAEAEAAMQVLQQASTGLEWSSTVITEQEQEQVVEKVVCRPSNE